MSETYDAAVEIREALQAIDRNLALQTSLIRRLVAAIESATASLVAASDLEIRLRRQSADPDETPF